jgi:60 kDa SS-A/Ro ribonucleoprotein
VYASGTGMKGKLTWEPVALVTDALEQAFYASFGNLQPTGKRTLLALDVSSSMDWETLAGSPLTPREASSALALVTLTTEKQVHVTAFQETVTPLNLSACQRLDDVILRVSGLPFGGTNCALPMLYALERKVPVDAFVIYTDSETWAGDIHPVQALKAYREQMGIAAKLVVVGMVSNGFSIADPEDGGMLDVVGFDSATPNVIADFIRDD